MATLQNTKPLSSRTVEVMKPGDKIKADTGENTGLRVKCGATGVKTFFYRYTSPITSNLVQVKIGNFPETSLDEPPPTSLRLVWAIFQMSLQIRQFSPKQASDRPR